LKYSDENPTLKNGTKHMEVILNRPLKMGMRKLWRRLKPDPEIWGKEYLRASTKLTPKWG
jgi:hypothetical protein